MAPGAGGVVSPRGRRPLRGFGDKRRGQDPLLAAEADPVILGYDEAEWARRLDYHDHPLEPALALVEAVRANTVALIRRMREEAWQRVGRHSESGRYSAEDWLKIYAEHLEGHARQIEANMAAWRAAKGAAT